MSATVSAADAVRAIDRGVAPDRFARGWHCLGLAAQFADGSPHGLDAFGTRLVVFADSTGRLNVLDGYCRHLGADLSRGTVTGDEIACPFHDWRWSGDGRCAHIPYAGRVPPRARTRSWPVLERNGQLFVWNDPEGNAPIPDQDIPEIAGCGSPQWSAWAWRRLEIDNANCREIVDNVADMAHFYYVHFAFPTYFKNVFEAHVATQYLDSRGRPDVGGGGGQYAGADTTLRSQASYYGPSYMINDLWSTIGGTTVESVLVNCHYPVTPTSFVLQYGVMVKKLPGVDDATADKIAGRFAASFQVGFEQDVAIWQNKVRIDNPLLCEQDGPVYQLRRWYQQFYVDVAQVSEQMTNRFEFEVDTEHAVRAWEREVADNLARRDAGVRTAVPTAGPALS
ncbi:MAG: aromatic ring-hydroxylating dioxygenase subunit alpha [Jatrophihabitans sp.]|nr:MAG: aromatic ring-hydroxylating dioxygenase subunit alpha [Jatrophihabitans sp.]